MMKKRSLFENWWKNRLNQEDLWNKELNKEEYIVRLDDLYESYLKESEEDRVENPQLIKLRLSIFLKIVLPGEYPSVFRAGKEKLYVIPSLKWCRNYYDGEEKGGEEKVKP